MLYSLKQKGCGTQMAGVKDVSIRVGQCSKVRSTDDADVNDNNESDDDVEEGNILGFPKVKTRMSPSGFIKFIREISPKQRKDVEDIGFGPLLEMQAGRVQGQLGYWLLDRFDIVKSAIILPSNELVVTEEDIHLAMGFPWRKAEIEEGGSRTKTPNYEELCNEWVKQWPGRVVGDVSDALLLKTMTNQKQGGDVFKRNFVVYVVSKFMKGHKNDKVYHRILNALGDISAIPNLNWCKFVLRSLHECVEKWNNNRSKEFKGPLMCLMYIYLDRVAFGIREVPRRFPLMSAWSQNLISRRVRDEKKKRGQFGEGRLDGIYQPDVDGGKTFQSGPSSNIIEIKKACVQKVAEAAKVFAAGFGNYVDAIREAQLSFPNCNIVDKMYSYAEKMMELYSELQSTGDGLPKPQTRTEDGHVFSTQDEELFNDPLFWKALDDLEKNFAMKGRAPESEDDNHNNRGRTESIINGSRPIIPMSANDTGEGGAHTNEDVTPLGDDNPPHILRSPTSGGEGFNGERQWEKSSEVAMHISVQNLSKGGSDIRKDTSVGAVECKNADSGRTITRSVSALSRQKDDHSVSTGDRSTISHPMDFTPPSFALFPDVGDGGVLTPHKRTFDQNQIADGSHPMKRHKSLLKCGHNLELPTNSVILSTGRGRRTRPPRIRASTYYFKSPYCQRYKSRLGGIQNVEAMVADWIFSDDTAEHSLDVTVYADNTLSVRRALLNTLATDAAINGALLNFWSHLLNLDEDSRNSTTISRFFVSFSPIEVLVDGQAFQSIGKKANTVLPDVLSMFSRQMDVELSRAGQIKLSTLGLMFVPMLLKNKYFLICFNFAKSKTQILDVMIQTPDFLEEQLALTSVLADYLSIYMRGKMSKANKIRSFEVEVLKMSWMTAKDVSVDSGVYVMRFMETYYGSSTNWALGIKRFSDLLASRLRVKFCYSIVNRPSNKVRSQVLEAARKFQDVN